MHGGRAPTWLSDYAREEWNRVVPELVRLDLCATIDESAMVAYCEAYATFRCAQEHTFPGPGLVSTNHKTRTETPSVWLKVRNEAANQMRSYLAEFGLSPKARAALGAVPKKEEVDPYEEIFD